MPAPCVKATVASIKKEKLHAAYSPAVGSALHCRCCDRAAVAHEMTWTLKAPHDHIPQLKALLMATMQLMLRLAGEANVCNTGY